MVRQREKGPEQLPEPSDYEDDGPTEEKTLSSCTCFSCLCYRTPSCPQARNSTSFELPAVQTEFSNGSIAASNPEHLVIMVSGIVGSASDWRYAAEQFRTRLGNKVKVHCSSRNASTLTFDGVDVMGHRLAKEVKEVVNQSPGVKKISFLAHSLGGLVARYAIGKLYLPAEPEISVCDPQERTTAGSERDDACSAQDNSKTTTGSGRAETCSTQSRGTVAVLQPINFITVATPHLGSRGNKQLPFLCGSSFLEKVASFSAHWFVGRTGKHLFLTDGDKSQLPLLRRMVTDCDEGKFISALQAFKRHVVYANASHDSMVGWRTASIRRECEVPKIHNVPVNPKYPHILQVEDTDDNSDSTKKALDPVEEEMITGLTQVPWQRVDVKFRKTPQRLVAHSTIQVKYYWMHLEGADIIAHIIDRLEA